MRLCRYNDNRLGVVKGDKVHDLLRSASAAGEDRPGRRSRNQWAPEARAWPHSRTPISRAIFRFSSFLASCSRSAAIPALKAARRRSSRAGRAAGHCGGRPAEPRWPRLAARRGCRPSAARGRESSRSSMRRFPGAKAKALSASAPQAGCPSRRSPDRSGWCRPRSAGARSAARRRGRGERSPAASARPRIAQVVFRGQPATPGDEGLAAEVAALGEPGGPGAGPGGDPGVEVGRAPGSPMRKARKAISKSSSRSGFRARPGGLASTGFRAERNGAPTDGRSPGCSSEPWPASWLPRGFRPEPPGPRRPTRPDPKKSSEADSQADPVAAWILPRARSQPRQYPTASSRSRGGSGSAGGSSAGDLWRHVVVIGAGHPGSSWARRRPGRGFAVGVGHHLVGGAVDEELEHLEVRHLLDAAEVGTGDPVRPSGGSG